jgi:hypothetical protein
MLTFHQRMAELWRLKTKRPLTEKEETEMIMCLKANEGYAHKLMKLQNLSLQASLVNDYDWLHDLCAEIDKLEAQFAPKLFATQRIEPISPDIDPIY